MKNEIRNHLLFLLVKELFKKYKSIFDNNLDSKEYDILDYLISSEEK